MRHHNEHRIHKDRLTAGIGEVFQQAAKDFATPLTLDNAKIYILFLPAINSLQSVPGLC